MTSLPSLDLISETSSFTNWITSTLARFISSSMLETSAAPEHNGRLVSVVISDPDRNLPFLSLTFSSLRGPLYPSAVTFPYSLIRCFILPSDTRLLLFSHLFQFTHLFNLFNLFQFTCVVAIPSLVRFTHLLLFTHLLQLTVHSFVAISTLISVHSLVEFPSLVSVHSLVAIPSLVEIHSLVGC